MSSEVGAAIAGTVAIVGGGIIGLSAAWRLAQQGWHVTVFDQRRMGQEASWAGAGMLAPGGEVDGPSPLAVSLLESRALYPPFIAELTAESAIAIDLQQNGALDLAYSDAEWGDLQARAERQRELGIASKTVPVNRVRAFWPRVRVEGLVGALFYPGDAIVNSRQVLQALRTVCVQRGVQLAEDTRVCSVAVKYERVSLASSRGTEPFSHAIVASGAWSSRLAAEGVPSLPASEPVKGHLLAYKQPLETCTTILRHGHTYLLQRANGLLIAGASVERVGFNAAIDEDVVRSLIDQAGTVLPHLRETSPTEVWTGFRPDAEGLQLGSWHSSRLALAYGHYRNGILLAPWTAKQLALQLGQPK